MESDNPTLLDLLVGLMGVAVATFIWGASSLLLFLVLKILGMGKDLAWNTSSMSVAILLFAAVLALIFTKPRSK